MTLEVLRDHQPSQAMKPRTGRMDAHGKPVMVPGPVICRTCKERFPCAFNKQVTRSFKAAFGI